VYAALRVGALLPILLVVQVPQFAPASPCGLSIRGEREGRGRERERVGFFFELRLEIFFDILNKYSQTLQSCSSAWQIYAAINDRQNMF
jgi:hypothetical protein